MSRTLGILLVLSLALPGQAKEPKEQAYCDQLAQKLDQTSVGDPELQGYLDTVGQRLASKLMTNPYTFRFRAIESKQANAYAICAGWVFVTVPMLREVRDEAELAAVLAHEIIHNDERHLLRNQRKTALLRTLAGRGEKHQLLVALFGTAGLLKFSREYEEDADEDGVKLIMKAGYDGDANIRLLERMASRSQKSPARFLRLLASHPTFAHRIHKVRRDIKKMRFFGFKVIRSAKTPEFAAMQARLKALPPGRD